MEAGKRQVSSTSTSSFTADLFGSKESSPSSSSGIFSSIFSPPNTVAGKNSSTSKVIGSWQKQNPGNQAWNTKQGTPALCTEGATGNTPYKDRSSMFQEERAEPCHLSSSLYYGGQDVYSHSPSNHAPGSYPPLFKKDGGEDDPNGNNSNGASRGNWWQGSLYY